METDNMDLETKYILNPRYGLRPDKGRAIIYLRDSEQFRRAMITTPRAIILSLLDGKRTLLDLVDILQKLFDISADESRKAIQNFIGLDRISYLFDGTGIPEVIRVEDLPPGVKIRTYDTKAIAKAGQDYSVNGKLKSPLSIVWLITSRCFTDCIYCYACKRYIHPRAMTLHERNLSLIDEMIDMQVATVAISGGDPFMHPHIIEYIKRLHEGDIECDIATKVPLSEKQIGKLIDTGQKLIQISIDAPNAEIADFMMQTPGWFDKIIDTIKMLKKAGIEIRVNCVLTSFNTKYAEETVLMLNSLGVERVKLTNYGYSLYRHSEALWVPKEEARELAGKIDDLQSRCPETIIHYQDEHKDFSEMSEEERTRGWPFTACTAFKEILIIAADGACVCTEEMLQNEQYILGNINDQTIQGVWDSKRFDELAHPPREMFKNTVCYNCNEFDDCHERGYCLRDSYKAYGTIFAPMPQCPKAPPGRKMIGTL